MGTNIIVDISPSGKILVFESKCCQPMKLHDCLKFNILRKKWMIKFIFGMHINIEVFYKLIVSFRVCVNRHAQSTQNNKFSISLQYLQKSIGVKLVFCLQINAKIFCKVIVSFWVWIASMPKLLKTTSLQYLCNISRKTWMMKLVFCLQINVKGFF